MLGLEHTIHNERVTPVVRILAVVASAGSKAVAALRTGMGADGEVGPIERTAERLLALSRRAHVAVTG